MLPTVRDIYSHRTATAWANLGDALRYVGDGCLDAPEHVPARCTRAYGEGPDAYAMAVQCPRPDLPGSPQGLNAALKEAIAARRHACQRAADNSAREQNPTT